MAVGVAVAVGEAVAVDVSVGVIVEVNVLVAVGVSVEVAVFVALGVKEEINRNPFPRFTLSAAPNNNTPKRSTRIPQENKISKRFIPDMPYSLRFSSSSWNILQSIATVVA